MIQLPSRFLGMDCEKCSFPDSEVDSIPSHFGQSKSSAAGGISILMPATGSFLVCAVGCTIRFGTNSDEAFDLLNRYVFPSLRREPADSRQADIDLHLLQSDKEFQLIVDDRLIATADRPKALLRQLIDWLDRTLVQRLTGLHAIHAGAVLMGDKALVLPGASHCGKSSLVAELLRRGAVCFSDEYALIDAEGRVHAYPRALLLRNGDVIQTPVAPRELDATVATTSAQVGWILVLKYDSSASWSIKPEPQSTALLMLLQNTPHVLAERPEMVSAFQRAVEDAACYSGSRAEAADAVTHILRLVSSTA